MLHVVQIAQKAQLRGAEIFASQLSEEMRRQGCDSRVVYLYACEDDGLLLSDGDVALDGSEDHPIERRVGFHPGLLRRLVRELRLAAPDVVQVNGARSVKYGVLSRVVSRGSWVIVYRNIGEPSQWVTGWPKRALYRRLVMSRIDGVIGVSQATLDGVRSLHRISVPGACIPRAVDTERFKPNRSREVVRSSLGCSLSAPVVLWVGSLTFEKRVDRLVRVFVAVRAALPQSELWIIGEGPERAGLGDAIEELGLSESVRVLGIRHDVADYMQAADVMCLTSDTEGLPGVLLEAGLSGVPVVATKVGGVAECVLDGQTGILVEPTDEIGLSQAILSLLRDPATRTSMGRQASVWVSKTFSLTLAVQRYFDLYSAVLRQHRRRTPPVEIASGPDASRTGGW